MKIEIFGSGCSKCRELEKRAKEAAKKAGLKAEVTHVFDMNEIIERGIISVPALAVDGKIVISGKLPELSELIQILKK
ncbi:MAG: thioredoxin family protein [Candidatus Micrarchaeota archaeon]|nr:thioredoxin family protein [Candidatus Micrarchaeota archaeon]